MLAYVTLSMSTPIIFIPTSHKSQQKSPRVIGGQDPQICLIILKYSQNNCGMGWSALKFEIFHFNAEAHSLLHSVGSKVHSLSSLVNAPSRSQQLYFQWTTLLDWLN